MKSNFVRRVLKHSKRKKKNFKSVFIFRLDFKISFKKSQNLFLQLTEVIWAQQNLINLIRSRDTNRKLLKQEAGREGILLVWFKKKNKKHTEGSVNHVTAVILFLGPSPFQLFTMSSSPVGHFRPGYKIKLFLTHHRHVCSPASSLALCIGFFFFLIHTPPRLPHANLWNALPKREQQYLSWNDGVFPLISFIPPPRPAAAAAAFSSKLISEGSSFFFFLASFKEHYIRLLLASPSAPKFSGCKAP